MFFISSLESTGIYSHHTCDPHPINKRLSTTHSPRHADRVDAIRLDQLTVEDEAGAIASTP
jgi:hypothetical protein